MELVDLTRLINDAAEKSSINILETLEIPSADGEFSPVPGELEPRLFESLNERYRHGLYSHQAVAIQAIIGEEDVCLATPTASGKSLVFMTAAGDLLLSSPNATVLALYPVKALIQDQVSKWNEMFGPLGVSVGYIDGSVQSNDRLNILRSNRIVLMTPDVLHAWMMGNLKKREVAAFLRNLRYLVLDEAHVYSGVFGSNMAYLIRRLQAVSGLERIISSTATVGEPERFIENLTGRKPRVFTEHDDTAPKPPKAIMLCSTPGDSYKNLVKFVVELSKEHIGKFIAFGDSRRLVETFVAATKRYSMGESGDSTSSEIDEDIEEEISEELQAAHILPYRAGYEEEDRKAIQTALERGDLRGVVATSGLELGIDIGDISTVVLLGTPGSIQSFRQRLGRVGRRNPGACVLVDTKGLVTSLDGGLKEYFTREAEKGWLYLENRYIQFTNALCAAAEVQSATDFRPDPFRTLPKDFLKWLNNELEPTETVPGDFFPLKQRAQNGPHFEFPVRSGIEKNFKVRRKMGPNVYSLGSLTHSQMLREGYPGAIYYYMARPHRVFELNHRHGEINVKNAPYYTTKPITQNMVFPKFPNGVLNMVKSALGFVAEAELQVSERVTGFNEIRGSAKSTHMYEQGSLFSEKPLARSFETTGVCWCIPNTQLMIEPLAIAVLEAFCLRYGIHSNDVGIGTFHTNVSPLGGNNCKGICIYDATHGSLRLTQQLAENFGEVLEETVNLLTSQDDCDPNLISKIAYLKECYSDMLPATFETVSTVPEPPPETQEWVEVFAVGEKVLYKNGGGHVKEMYVHGYRYTPVGLMYELGSGESAEKSTTRFTEVLAAEDDIKTVLYNLFTGDIRKP